MLLLLNISHYFRIYEQKHVAKVRKCAKMKYDLPGGMGVLIVLLKMKEKK